MGGLPHRAMQWKQRSAAQRQTCASTKMNAVWIIITKYKNSKKLNNSTKLVSNRPKKQENIQKLLTKESSALKNTPFWCHLPSSGQNSPNIIAPNRLKMISSVTSSGPSIQNESLFLLVRSFLPVKPIMNWATVKATTWSHQSRHF